MEAFQQKKTHIKGGGLLYGVVSIKKKALKGGEVYYMEAFQQEKKHIKGGGLLYGGVSIKNKQNTYLHTLGFRAVSSAA